MRKVHAWQAVPYRTAMYCRPQLTWVLGLVRQLRPAVAILEAGMDWGMPYAPVVALTARGFQFDSDSHKTSTQANCFELRWVRASVRALATVSGTGVGAGVGVGVGVAIGGVWPTSKYVELGSGVAVASGVGPLRTTDGPKSTLMPYSAKEVDGAASGWPGGSGGFCHVVGPRAMAVPETTTTAAAAAKPAANARCLNSSSPEFEARTHPFARCGHARCCRHGHSATGRGLAVETRICWNCGREIPVGASRRSVVGGAKGR